MNALRDNQIIIGINYGLKISFTDKPTENVEQ